MRKAIFVLLATLAIADGAQAYTGECRDMSATRSAKIQEFLDTHVMTDRDRLRLGKLMRKNYCAASVASMAEAYFSTHWTSREQLTALNYLTTFEDRRPERELTVRANGKVTVCSQHFYQLKRTAEDTGAYSSGSLVTLGNFVENGAPVATACAQRARLIEALEGLWNCARDGGADFGPVYDRLEAFVDAFPSELKFTGTIEPSAKPWVSIIRAAIGKAMYDMSPARAVVDLAPLTNPPYAALMSQKGFVLADNMRWGLEGGGLRLGTISPAQGASGLLGSTKVELSQSPTGIAEKGSLGNLCTSRQRRVGTEIYFESRGQSETSHWCTTKIQSVQSTTPAMEALYYATAVDQADEDLEGHENDRDRCVKLGPNTFGTQVGQNESNAFPHDINAFGTDGFCNTLAHEFSHAYRGPWRGNENGFKAFRQLLIDRAGSTGFQYLRTSSACRDLPPDGNQCSRFQAQPQEMVASMAQQYLSNSMHTFALAANRFLRGYKEPMNQFVFMLDLYRRTSTLGRFFVVDGTCNVATQDVTIIRDLNGKISGFQVGGTTYDFTLDTEGFVAAIDADTTNVGLSQYPSLIVDTFRAGGATTSNRVELFGRFAPESYTPGLPNWRIEIFKAGGTSPMLRADVALSCNEQTLTCVPAGAGAVQMWIDPPSNQQRPVRMEINGITPYLLTSFPTNSRPLFRVEISQRNGTTPVGVKKSIEMAVERKSTISEYEFDGPYMELANVSDVYAYEGNVDLVDREYLRKYLCNAPGAAYRLTTPQRAVADTDGDDQVTYGDWIALDAYLRSPSTARMPQLFGDLDNDGKVKELDSVQLRDFVAGTLVLSDAQKRAADVGLDGYWGRDASGLATYTPVTNAADLDLLGDFVTDGDQWDWPEPEYLPQPYYLGGSESCPWTDTVNRTGLRNYLCLVPGATLSELEQLRADMDGDGVLTYADFAIADSYGRDPLGWPTRMLFGDLNGDGKVDLPDLYRLDGYLAGTITLTPHQKLLADIGMDGYWQHDANGDVYYVPIVNAADREVLHDYITPGDQWGWPEPESLPTPYYPQGFPNLPSCPPADQ